MTAMEEKVGSGVGLIEFKLWLLTSSEALISLCSISLNFLISKIGMRLTLTELISWDYWID